MEKFRKLTLVFLFLIFLPGCKRDIPPYEIGVFFSSSEHDEVFNENIRMGMDIGFEEINTIKGVRGRMLRGVYVETPKDESLMIQTIKDSILSRSIKVVISHDNRITETFNSSDSFDIILFSDWKGRFDGGCRSIYAITPRIKTEGKLVGRYVVRNLKSKKGFLLLSSMRKRETLFAEGFKKGFVDESNGTLNTINLADDSREREELFSRIKSFSVDVVVIVSNKETAQLIQNVRESGYSGKIVIPSETAYLLQKEVETSDFKDVYYAAPDYNPDSKKKIIANFQERFQRKNEQKADYTASVHYDLAEIIAYFLEINGDDTRRIQKFLGKIRNYNAVTGRTSYYPDGAVEKPIRLKEIKEGPSGTE